MKALLGHRDMRRCGWLLAALALAGEALAEVRVQDIARLQGQRTNTLMGYGLIVGLNGTGDGGGNEHTLRALMAMHTRFHQPALSAEELKATDNVALVAVEAVVPEFGARQGQTVDVVVSAFAAESLAGGQLLTTPLQYAAFDPHDPATQQILALAGGRVEIPDAGNPQRGVIRSGCTLEADFFYNFIAAGYITLVMDDEHAGFQWTQLVARAINHELRTFAEGGQSAALDAGRVAVPLDFAEALDPKNVRVRIPEYETARPAGFISRVLQTDVFLTPRQPARVCISRSTNQVSFTGTVTISPTVLQLPGLGTLAVGQAAPATDTGGRKEVQFQELLATLSKLQLPPAQMVAAIEHLYHTGTLHAQLVYTE